MTEYRVTHTTRYEYEEQVSHCHNMGHLKPLSNQYQKNHQTEFFIQPRPQVLKERQDYFGNQYIYFAIDFPHQQIEVCSKSQLSVTEPSYPDFESTMSLQNTLEAFENCINDFDFEAAEFCFESRFIRTSELVYQFARQFFRPDRSVLSAAMEMTVFINQHFEYDPKATTILTPLYEVLQNKKGVCQDFTHLAIAAVRSMGLAARYVSGYIETLPPPGKEKLRGSDATHAWFAIYSPDTGWVDFDPTNGKYMTDEYITTAIGRDFADVSPLKGVLFGGGKHRLKVSVDVERFLG